MERLRTLLFLDEAILRAFERWRVPFVTRLMTTFTRLGDASSWAVLSALLWLMGGHPRLIGSSIALAAIIATVFSQLIKRLVRRPRPTATVSSFTAILEHPDAFSFPSGHAAAATAVAIALSGHGGASALAHVIPCCIAISRIYIGAHYPLDVMIGAIIGLVAGFIARVLMAGV